MKDRFPFAAERTYEELIGNMAWEEIWPLGDGDGIGYSGPQEIYRLGWAAVKNPEGKWGIADLNGKFTVPQVYDEFYPTGYGYIMRAGGETDFLDPDLKAVMSTR